MTEVEEGGSSGIVGGCVGGQVGGTLDGGEEWEMWKRKCPERGRLDEAELSNGV